MTQTGSGTLTLGGSNTYSGTTTVNGGTLRVGMYDEDSGQTTGTLGSGNVVLGSGCSLIFNLRDDITVSNAISGSGSLTQSGSSTLILTGNNTYSGNTTIASGWLQVGAGSSSGSFGSGSVVFNSGGGLIFDRSDSITLNNTINTNNLVQDSGTVIFTGSVSARNVSINSGSTMQIGSGGTSGWVTASSLGDDGSLVFNRSDNVTFANTISGSGSLTKQGTGTLVITGSESCGSTTITAGTLQIGNGGTAGSIGSGGITNNSSLVFNNTGTVTAGGVISGTGSLTQQGTGTLVLGGANTYSGITTINGGTLQVGDGYTSGQLGTGNVTDNSSLVFNRTDSVTVSNAIGGTGTLTKQGTGADPLRRQQLFRRHHGQPRYTQRHRLDQFGGYRGQRSYAVGRRHGWRRDG